MSIAKTIYENQENYAELRRELLKDDMIFTSIPQFIKKNKCHNSLSVYFEDTIQDMDSSVKIVEEDFTLLISSIENK